MLELKPDDEVALTHLGHTAFQTGQGDEGVKLLEQVAERMSGNSTAAISLVDMYRTLGQHDEALAAAVKVAEADPGDPLYTLDVAELSLETGDLDEAAAAFDRLREIVDNPEQEVWALHGTILVELESRRLRARPRPGPSRPWPSTPWGARRASWPTSRWRPAPTRRPKRRATPRPPASPPRACLPLARSWTARSASRSRSCASSPPRTAGPWSMELLG